MSPSIGDKIIAAIHRGKIAKVIDNTENAYVEHFTLQFHNGAAEQLEAVVEAHIEERVRVRLELDKQQELVNAEKMLVTACKLLDRDPRGDTIGVPAMMNYLRHQSGLPEQP